MGDVQVANFRNSKAYKVLREKPEPWQLYAIILKFVSLLFSLRVPL